MSLPTPSSITSNRPGAEHVSSNTAPDQGVEVQSHLTSDIEATRGLLEGMGVPQSNSLGALSSLSKTCAAVWHNEPGYDQESRSFFLFEDSAEIWADSEPFRV